MARREQDRAAHSGAEIHERGCGDREGDECEQDIEIADGCGFVMRRVRDARADRFGIEFAEKEQRFGRDAELRVETSARAQPGNTHLR